MFQENEILRHFSRSELWSAILWSLFGSGCLGGLEGPHVDSYGPGLGSALEASTETTIHCFPFTTKNRAEAHLSELQKKSGGRKHSDIQFGYRILGCQVVLTAWSACNFHAAGTQTDDLAPGSEVLLGPHSMVKW